MQRKISSVFSSYTRPPNWREEPGQLLAIDIGGARLRLHRLPAPPLPVPDEIADEVARPAHAALEEGEAQIGEAVGHAAEDEGRAKAWLALAK